ncbi:MAG: hypothetical protein AAGA77_14290 [Bacteroidota bacterium]
MHKQKEKYKLSERLELGGLNVEDTRKFENINCPSCSSEILSADISLQNSMAKCSNCNAIFSIENEIEKVKSKEEVKQQFLRPEGIDLFHYKDELDITLDQHIQGLDLWAISLIPIFALGAIMIFFMSDKPMSPYIPITLTMISLYYIYKGLSYSKYKTYIEVNQKFLNIKHRPNNLKKDKSFAADEIDQLYLKPSTEMPGHFVIHMIINGVEGQRHEKLMKVNSLSKAKFLEQEIEKYLNIMDRKVPESGM